MRHVIKKQVFDLWVHRQLDALALQQRISDRFPEDIVPELEKRFDEVSDETSAIQIESLEIDLGLITEEMIDTGEWAMLFGKKLGEALQESMTAAATGRGGMVVSVADSVFSQWCFFIEHGYLPWNAEKPSVQWFTQALESLAGNYSSASALRDLIRRNALAAERIALQHTPEFLSHLVESFTAEKQSMLSDAVQELAGWLNHIAVKHSPVAGLAPKAIETRIWIAILQRTAQQGPEQRTEAILAWLFTGWLQLKPAALAVLSGKQPVSKKYPVIEPVIRRITRNVLKDEPGVAAQQHTPPGIAVQPQATENKETAPAAPEKKQTVQAQEAISAERPDEALEQVSQILKQKATAESQVPDKQAAAAAEGIYSLHAGLALLHPFLHNLFRKLKLVKDGRFENEAKQERAICLLHELAESGTPVQEYNLPLAKLLCGWPLHQPVDTGIVLTATEKNEVQHLLKAAIEQWEILNNTSTTAFQETFLQREGKLHAKNGKWYLQVEKRSLDVLLSRLPWMISMIKLPWMKELLLVEWA